MTIANVTSINSQPLKPAMSFKGDVATEEKTIQPKEGMTQNEKIGWGVGGAAAIAATIWGIVAATKGKANAKETVKPAEELANKGIEKIKNKLYTQYENKKHLYEGNKIVDEFNKMRAPEDLKTKAKLQIEYNKMDWDMSPVSRQELIEQMQAVN